MTRDGIFFTFGAVVAGAIVAASITRPIPEHRGTIICHADGTTFIGHVDTWGIELADVSHAMQMMCELRRDRMGV